MNARSKVLAVSVSATFLACRAIVGIEELEVVDGGTSPDAGTDVAAQADAHDSGTSAADAYAARIATCVSGADCRKCCKDNFKGLRDFEQSEESRSCFCRPSGGCRDACGADYCKDGGSPSAPGPNCAKCLDDHIVDGDCTATCTSIECQAGRDCMRACPPPP